MSAELLPNGPPEKVVRALNAAIAKAWSNNEARVDVVYISDFGDLPLRITLKKK